MVYKIEFYAYLAYLKYRYYFIVFRNYVEAGSGSEFIFQLGRIRGGKIRTLIPAKSLIIFIKILVIFMANKDV